MPANQSRLAKHAVKSKSKSVSPKPGPVAQRIKAKVKVASSSHAKSTAKQQKVTLLAAKKSKAPKLTKADKKTQLPAQKLASEKQLPENQDGAALRSAHKLSQKWSSLYEKSKTIKPVAYKMSASYESKTPIQHKVLGWGYILSNHENRLEVLFQDGVRYLISNYKPTS